MIVVLGVYLIWDQRGTKADLDDRATGSAAQAEQKSGQALSLQQELQSKAQSKQQGIDDLQGQIDQLKQQRAASEQAYRLISGNNIDWYTAMDSLFFGADTLEVIYQSVSATPEGTVFLEGQAPAEGALARLPSQLNALSDDLDFQSIQSDPTSIPPSFSATFQVRQ